MFLGQTEEDGLGIVCGSRAHLEQDAIASRSVFRTFLMKGASIYTRAKIIFSNYLILIHAVGFHFLVWLFAVRSIRDTQCGFKLMTRSTARLCFPSLHIERWLFLINFSFF